MSEDDLHARLRSLEERVARLDDLEAIRRLKCEHALASDDPANLPQRFAAIVTDDFVADYGEGFGVIHGKEELRKFLTNVPFTWTMGSLKNLSRYDSLGQRGLGGIHAGAKGTGSTGAVHFRIVAPAHP